MEQTLWTKKNRKTFQLKMDHFRLCSDCNITTESVVTPSGTPSHRMVPINGCSLSRGPPRVLPKCICVPANRADVTMEQPLDLEEFMPFDDMDAFNGEDDEEMMTDLGSWNWMDLGHLAMDKARGCHQKMKGLKEWYFGGD